MKKNVSILIIDDEEDMLNASRKILDAHGYSVLTASDGKKALKILQLQKFDVILCDLLMPELDGIQLMEELKKNDDHTPFILLSAYGTIDRAVAAIKAGAFDFIEKPFDMQHINLVIEKALRHRNLYEERNNLIKQLQEKYKFDNIIGNCTDIRKIFEMIEDVAKSDTNILITGESGTGKELIARSIHAHSDRKTKPFVPVNCGAFPANLFEAELFGYEKGAFTGANQKKIGLLEFADTGTFFLDEVCELPPELQVKLLRTLQDKQFRRVGGNDLIKIDIRLISATNRNLKESLNEGQLREDFYYRLNVINIHIPPLRERRGDIRLLAEYFLSKELESSSKPIKRFSDEVLNIFDNYDWPGNIRELENVVERAVTLSKGAIISASELSPELLKTQINQLSFDNAKFTDVKQNMIDDLEKKYLLHLLQKYNGHVTKIANEAGMSRRNIHRLLKEHGLDPNSWRK